MPIRDNASVSQKMMSVKRADGRVSLLIIFLYHREHLSLTDCYIYSSGSDWLTAIQWLISLITQLSESLASTPFHHFITRHNAFHHHK